MSETNQRKEYQKRLRQYNSSIWLEKAALPRERYIVSAENSILLDPDRRRTSKYIHFNKSYDIFWCSSKNRLNVPQKRAILVKNDP